MKVDDQGIGEHAFTSAALWNVAVQFRDTPANSFPLQEPYYEAGRCAGLAGRADHRTDPSRRRAARGGVDPRPSARALRPTG